jgi:uncharacterized membrane protein required for colicin V production
MVLMNRLTDKIIGLCLGVALIALSITIIFKPIGYYLGQYIDFTEVRPFICPFLFLLGTLFVWTTFRKSK